MLYVRAVLILALVVLCVNATTAAEVMIIQKNKSFSVREVTIRVGEPLTFVNDDTVTHNVYSETKGLTFEIELQSPGRSNTIRFREPGLAEVECAIHPKMKLLVHIRP